MEIECEMVEGSDSMIYFIPSGISCPYDKSDIDNWEQWHVDNCIAQFWDGVLSVK